MSKFSGLVATLTVAVAMAPVAAHAQLLSFLTGSRHRPPAAAVPEIDASTSLLALAAVAAALAFVWERRRRMMR